MNAAPMIERSNWPNHPNFPAHTLLLGSHANFRDVAEYLAREVRKAEVPTSAERLFRRWMAAMRNHEAYEEGKLYPYLSGRWNVSMKPLVAGHEALSERKNAVFDSFANGGARLPEAFDSFRQALETHLDLEEDTVIPLLLELTPREFDEFCLR